MNALQVNGLQNITPEPVFSLIVPNFHQPIVSTGNYIRFIPMIVINAINSLFMTREREICVISHGIDAPNFQGSVHRGGDKIIKISRVKRKHHDIMCVFFEGFDEREVILEIPNFYRRIVTRTDYIRLSRVDYYASQKV